MKTGSKASMAHRKWLSRTVNYLLILKDTKCNPCFVLLCKTRVKHAEINSIMIKLSWCRR